MLFLSDQKRTWLQSFCTKVVKAGPVPKHVAFIMDGNRRFASKRCMERNQGHVMGFDKLAETLEWCLDLGITEVTVYAFSIENFKRSKEEVDGIMELTRQKFQRLLEEKDKIQENGVCLRVLGNITLLPRDLQEMIADTVLFSKNNTRAVLNVCLPYTSRDEICSAVRELAEGVQCGLIKSSDISQSLLEKCLYTSQSADPELLIRTSGEVRLSDYLLWQTTYSVLSFMEVLWPEFSIWHLLAGVLYYQRSHKNIQTARQEELMKRQKTERDALYQLVFFELQKQSEENLPPGVFHECFTRCSQEKEERIKKFLNHVESKRIQFFKSLQTGRLISSKS